ncbi:hypothetical protein KSC_003810 [Ktedonobacter sp. SOSP1-52]|uniref:MmyB family transcriptional regulator n=1 Tax=Ktedonobacter sp. SOSP1-52 TaxID=2778366 RepID=UPI001A2A1315|nr:helix-turn-helix domain-containing protein [Ktedonobacter sp. SOSP1-52]GHO61489.1 hypothetical protein KSC_003810 [Ktedonobacter sp. SOSP1-52]
MHIIPCWLPTRNPWPNRIEPKWVHGKRAIVEPARLLPAQELKQRERLLPAQFHLPVGGRRRRTPGLRREELAHLAGIGLTWYVKLEQGQDIQVSAQVLESLACTLQLTPDERNYLFLPAREQFPLPLHTPLPNISVELQNVLDALLPNPAFVTNERLDILGWNRSASRVFADYASLPAWERNLVWLIIISLFPLDFKFT